MMDNYNFKDAQNVLEGFVKNGCEVITTCCRQILDMWADLLLLSLSLVH